MVRCLVEGNSIRATVRITGVAKNTVTKLLVDLGAACSEYQDRVLRDLPLRYLQGDEIWSFCNAKARNVPVERRDDPAWGDVWTWTMIDRESKLIPTWYVGDRSSRSALIVMDDLRSRVSGHLQITTDGFHLYPEAVEAAFGPDASVRMPSASAGRPSWPRSEPHTSSARTSPCGWGCAASPG